MKEFGIKIMEIDRRLNKSWTKSGNFYFGLCQIEECKHILVYVYMVVQC